MHDVPGLGRARRRGRAMRPRTGKAYRAGSQADDRGLPAVYPPIGAKRLLHRIFTLAEIRQPTAPRSTQRRSARRVRSPRFHPVPQIWPLALLVKHDGARLAGAAGTANNLNKNRCRYRSGVPWHAHRAAPPCSPSAGGCRRSWRSSVHDLSIGGLDEMAHPCPNQRDYRRRRPAGAQRGRRVDRLRDGWRRQPTAARA